MSSNFIRESLFFISGAAIASFVTYKILEKKFKDLADEEIASVKAMYKRKLEQAQEPIPEIDLTKIEIQPIDTVRAEVVTVDNPYASLVTNLGYANNKKEENTEMLENENIEVIPPEDFGEYGYKCESLTYYKDAVLTYDDDTVVSDSASIIGPDALNTFGEYEDDSVFVRNHGMKTDFEILLDTRKYSNVVLGNSVDDIDDAE